jgi:hypothetical protein
LPAATTTVMPRFHSVSAPLTIASSRANSLAAEPSDIDATLMPYLI